jgi:3-deoxy-D-manno-octulosonate 8-phosphate phosphatase (KDO 8-P phosphatase)
MIKVLLLDFDGVLTDGKKLYDQTGRCLYKSASDKDFTAIKRFRAAGIPVVVLSGDPWNEAILKNRNIPCFVSRKIQKEEFLQQICSLYGAGASEIAFVGDDIFDLALLKLVGHPFVTKDSSIKSYFTSEQILERDGGCCVIAELFSVCRQRGLIPNISDEDELSRVLKLDIDEIF